MKTNPNQTREQTMGDLVVEQSGAGASKSLNKILARSVQATAEATAANERAAELRAEGVKIQLEWDHLCERYSQIADAIERASALRSELQAIADGGFEEALRASFDWGGDANKSKHIVVEVGKAVGAVPVAAKMIKGMRAELLAHANAMRDFAKENGLPAECTKDLVPSDAVQ